MIKNPLIIANCIFLFIVMLFISIYFGIVKYWESYFISNMVVWAILFNFPILIGLLYFIGLKLKKATLISLLFTLIYGISIYIIYNKKWNTDLNSNKTYVQGKIYDFDANSEGGGFVAKVRFNLKTEIYESETSYENRKEFKIGDSVEIRFSSIHPNINEVVRDFNK